MSQPIVIAAGGTGGHFFPAEALATELAARGHDLILMTDRRAGLRTRGIFADKTQIVLDGAGVAGKAPIARLRGLFALLKGTCTARKRLAEIRPKAVIGFGGYPSVPPILGSRLLTRAQRPVIILHEGNAVLGRANAMLARFSTVVATSFPHTARLGQHIPSHRTGMPVRPDIEALYDKDFVRPGRTIHLLIWGGSLGARVLSETVPVALGKLSPDLRSRLRVVQQVRIQDMETVHKQYETHGITCHLAPFFTDIPERLAQAHLVIGRAGGSSIAELAIAGRPAILIPLPIAASDEQSANAHQLASCGGAWMLRQTQLDPDTLCALVTDLLTTPGRLQLAAKAAKDFATPKSAKILADLIESKLSPDDTLPSSIKA